jgi:DNA-binding NtrC family response regulator
MKIYKKVIKNKMIEILVVDDELDMCQIISDILKEKGYGVHCSYNGEDALMKIKKNSYDFMVLDYKLNEMSGLIVLEKALQMIPSLKVIMISAFGDKYVKARARKLGVGDFLDKPFDLKRFTQAVQDILKR